MEKNNLSMFIRMMMKKCITIIIAIFPLFFPKMPLHASSVDLNESIRALYPEQLFYIGIGTCKKTQTPHDDQTVSEVLARHDIAKQISVHLDSETIVTACEDMPSRIFYNGGDCRSTFNSVIRETVNEFLRDSKIIQCSEIGDMIYAVAVMPRATHLKKLDENIRDSVEGIKESLEKAGCGDDNGLRKAEDELKKAIIYNTEKNLLEGIETRSSRAFEELENEISRLKERR